MKPLVSISFNLLDNSCICVGAKRYEDLATSVAPGIMSIRNSIWRSGETPGRSLGKMSRKLQTLGMLSKSFTSCFSLTTLAKNV